MIQSYWLKPDTTLAMSWSIRYQFDPKDSKAPVHEDNLTEAEVLSVLCLSLRPGLKNNRPCTVTIGQGQDIRPPPGLT